MRQRACLPLVVLGLVVAAPDCGGVSFEPVPDRDASIGSGARGDASSGGASGSGSGAGASGASTGTSTGSSSGTGASGASSGTSTGSSGSSGSGSTSGASSGGSSGIASSGSSGAVDAGGSGGGAKDAGDGGCGGGCGRARSCCGGHCVNPANDPFNCGACGVACGAGTYCAGSCLPPPCTVDGGACAGGETCCGDACCAQGRLCCPSSGPVVGGPSCLTPTAAQPTCPQGCAPLCVSDRNLKRDIEPVDEQAVLESIARMPVSTWSYKSDDPSVRHLGPMAQDFHAAFGLGSTDRAYDPIDAHGVELAAIKALYERLEKDHALIERLERENEELRQGAACGR